MRAPSPNELDELVQFIENMTVIISHLTYEMFQEAKKDNPHLRTGKRSFRRRQGPMPKPVATEKTLAMAEQIGNLLEILDEFLDRFKTILRMVDIATIERARQQHEKMRPWAAHDPISSDVVEKLDAIYEDVKKERGNDTTVFY